MYIPLKFLTFFLLALMYSQIFLKMQIRSFVYHTASLSVMSQLLFDNKFGSLEKLAADI